MYMPVCVLSRVQLFLSPWTVAHQAPLPMGFPRQEYWSGLPSPPPGDLPDPGIEPTPGTEPVSLGSPALTDTFLPTELSEKPIYIYIYIYMKN